MNLKEEYSEHYHSFNRRLEGREYRGTIRLPGRYNSLEDYFEMYKRIKEDYDNREGNFFLYHDSLIHAIHVFVYTRPLTSEEERNNMKPNINYVFTEKTIEELGWTGKELTTSQKELIEYYKNNS